MRHTLALIIVGVTWLLVINAAVNADTVPGFVLLLIVNCICAATIAILIEIDVRKSEH
jgi:hypothetical protein